MKVNRHHLARVIAERTTHLADATELAHEIAAYVLHERYTGSLDSLLRDVMQYRLEHGVVEATAISAHPLTAQVLDDIKGILRDEYPHAKAVMVDQVQDPSVVGGVRIELAQEQLDMTVAAKLNKFKRLTALERN
jgi:F0F1-type ATP synthase delta subunit